MDTTITVKPADPSNNSAPSFSFTATKTGSTFECKLDAGAFAACTTPKAFTGLTAGSHTFSVQAKDPAGNVDPTPATYTWTIDLAPPLLAVSTLLDGSFSNNATPNISGTATDALSGIKSVTVNGLAVTVGVDGAFSTAVTLIAGPNTITVVATDKAGNATTIGPRSVTYDPNAPAVTLTAPDDNSFSNVSPIAVSGTVSETATVTVSVNGSAPQSAIVTGTSFTASANLVSGQNHIDIVVTDQAGNIGSAKRTVTYDPDKPNLAITDPAQDITTPQKSYTLKGTVSDALTAVSKLVLTMDGQTYEPTITDGNFQQQLNFTAAKQYPIIITATDQAGNNATAQRNIIYAPVASGDVNSDGKVDVFDALLTLQYAVGLIEHTPNNDTKYLAAADVSPLDEITGKPKGDGVVNVFDALAILRKAVNLDMW